MTIVIRWLFWTLLVAVAPQAFAQIAPTGEHYAGRPSDTGYGGNSVNATGGLAAAIPLDIPPDRAGLPQPVQITYGGQAVGAAGVGWDLPLSYIRRDKTLAHRRPAFSPGALPVPREHVYLSLFGENIELVLENGVWVSRAGTLELNVRESAGTWLAYDGKGRTYTFIRPPTLGSTELWLLQSVSAAGGDSVQLTHAVTTWALEGGAGTAIDLVRVAYNTASPTSCAKNEIALTYGAESTPPVSLSLSVLGDKVLVRKHSLTLVDVLSRATCATPLQRLRRYELQYLPDADTRLPRLQSVRLFGREGSNEANAALPVASYAYGSATQSDVLRYQRTEAIDLPPGVQANQVAGTARDPSVNAPVAGERHAMWQSLTDVTGDGRPDLVFKKDGKLWVAYNRHAPDGRTTLGVGGDAYVELADATFLHGGLSTHTTTQRRFDYVAANRNTTNVWRQAIDVNGDGRVDIVDAAEEADHWVIYLNTAGGPTGVKWERRSFDIKPLQKALVDTGHAFADNHLPLSRRSTGTDVKVYECWQWDGQRWNPYTDGYVNHRCEGVDPDQLVVERHPERTFVEWQLLDLNGDGYLDFVFNSTPVDFQVRLPDTGPRVPPAKPRAGDVYPADYGIGGPLWRFFSPAPTNQMRVSFNVRGVRFAVDENPFALAVDLAVKDADRGVSEWRCAGSTGIFIADGACDDPSYQSEYAGLADVNGDGLVDRIVGRKVYLGAYAGAALTFANVYITLPGPLATQHNTHETQCAAGGAHRPTADQTQGLRDLTGDGIPDYFDKGKLWIGTGVGFREAIVIAGDPGFTFRFSHQTESCDGEQSNTDGGLFDINADGRPDVIGLDGTTLVVSQLAGGQGAGRPEAGRLVEVDNGYGAKTRIRYTSAKQFTDSAVPFPEIVVSSVATAGTQNLGGALAGSRHAYGNAELVFDSTLDRFVFGGYRRAVAVSLYSTPDGGPAGGGVAGAATVTDTWPLLDFDIAHKKEKRWLRLHRVGLVRDVLTLRGTPDPDPWSLLNVDVYDARVIGSTHYDWLEKVYEAPSDSAWTVDCLEMAHPLDYQASLATNDANALDVCRVHGFIFAASESAWYGAEAPPSDNNIQTRSQTLTVDDFGRPLLTEYDNDVFRDDDDVCVENAYAAPTAPLPRILNALASRRLSVCKTGLTVASESWTYDGLPVGSVSDGRLTAHNVDRRATDTGLLLNVVHLFDAAYDTAGNVSAVRTQRDGALRTTTFGYDTFGLVPVRTRVDATGLPATELVIGYDPVSVQPVSAKVSGQAIRGTDFDGYGRPIRATVTPPGRSLGVVSTTGYQGFANPDADGRRIITKRFTDPVAPANVLTASGTTATVYLDELGRGRRTELPLGSDYGNEVLVVGSRAYDDAGRVSFQADSYPKSQDAATAYGTSYFFRNTGDLDCIVRGRGPQAPGRTIDFATERFPTCFQRLFNGHVDTLDIRDAASLNPGSAQSDVVKRVVSSAIGRVLERATLKAGARLEYATYAHDRLGQPIAMTRFLDPGGAGGPVAWSWQQDSMGHTLSLKEPPGAIRSFRYSDWGELLETQWADGVTDHRLVRAYDALGRLTRKSEVNNGSTDPETVNTYAYDVGIVVSPHVAPTHVLGRLASATSASGRVAFSYDGYGSTNARTFTDSEGRIYVEKVKRHADGTLAALEFKLPDQGYASERVAYDYDSAARLKTMSFTGPGGDIELYKAGLIDALGRVRKASYGGKTSYEASYADVGRRLMNESTVSSAHGSRRVVFGAADALGREALRRELKDGALNGPKAEVAYDALGRLAVARTNDGATTTLQRQFGYDTLGNTVTLADGLGGAGAVLGYRTDDPDRICRIDYGNTGVVGTGCNVVHDEVGNIVSQATRTGSRQLSYFASGAVRTITAPAAHATFRYDPFGDVQELDVEGAVASDRRHDRSFGGLLERNDVVSAGVSNSVLTRRIPGPGGMVASRRGPGTAWVYRFGEMRGGRFFTDEDGAFVQEVAYQPFGESTTTGAQPGSAKYTKYLWNDGDSLAAFGLSHLGARIYDPVIGRFLSRDPMLIASTAARSNPYAFAINDPVNLADPTGLEAGLSIWATSDGSTSTDGSLGASIVLGVGKLFDWLGSGRAAPMQASAPAVNASKVADLLFTKFVVVPFLREEQRLGVEEMRHLGQTGRLDCFASLGNFGECAGNGAEASGNFAYWLLSIPEQMVVGMADDSGGRSQPGYIHPFERDDGPLVDIETGDGLENLSDRGAPRVYRKEEIMAEAIRRGERCEYCGVKLDLKNWNTPSSVRGDHYNPHWLDPVTEPGNLVISCRTCNGSGGKWGKTVGPGPLEWWPPGWGPRPKLKSGK